MSDNKKKSATSLSQLSYIQKFRALLAGLVVNLILGAIYNFGNIVGPISVYYNTTIQQALLALTLWLFFQTLTTTISLQLAEKFGYRVMNTVAL